MSVSKEDPKHGRWLLPLVIAGLIGFTYVFVNALPPADIAASTTSTTTSTTSTSTTTTSTTLPADVRAFLGEVDRFLGETDAIKADLHATNDAWERRDILYKEALAGFEEVKTSAEALSNDVTATSVPDAFGFPDLWPAVETGAHDLVGAVDAVIEGLKAPDSGEARRKAVEEFDTTVTGLTDALKAVRSAAP